MKTGKIMLRLSALFAAALLATAGPVSALAAENGITEKNGGSEAAGAVVDRERTGSLTIYKYDEALPEEEKENLGKPGADLSGYGVEGVKFAYYKVSGFETYTDEKAATDSKKGGGITGADGLTGGVITELRLVYTVDSGLQNIMGLTDEDALQLQDGRKGYTSTQLNRALGILYGAESEEELTKAKNALENYIKSIPEGTAGVMVTDEAGCASADGLAAGLYLVVETEVPVEVTSTTNPFFVSIPMTNAEGNGWNYDVTVYPKSQLEKDEEKPTLEKLVKNEGDNTYRKSTAASGGEELNYRLVAKLPKITSTATYLTEFVFTDEMEEGLSYVDDSFEIRLYENEVDARAGTGEAAVWSLQDVPPCFTLSPGEEEEGAQEPGFRNTDKRVISLTAEGLKKVNEAYSGKYMAVCYRAKLTEKAVPGDAGNKNEVTLSWKRTGGGREKLEDKAAVYTYGLSLQKLFYRGETALDIAESGLDAGKVKFLLQKDGRYVLAEAAEGTDTAGGDIAGGAAYHVTGFTEDKESATAFSPDSTGGRLLIYGLSAGNYILTEKETLPEYALLTGEFIFTIQETKTEGGIVTGASATGSGFGLPEGTRAQMLPYETAEGVSSGNALVYLEVINRRRPFLPGTGGVGVWPFIIAGGLLVAVSVVLLWRRKRKD